MVAGGQRPKPTKLHLIEGTYNVTAHRKRKLEPKPRGSLPPPPDWFSALQREIWDFGLGAVPPGMLKTLDFGVYTTWCVALVAHRQAVEQLNKLGPEGLLSRGPTRIGPKGADGNPVIVEGHLQQNPVVNAMNKQALIILRASAELGFSPSSRARVTIDPTADGADLESKYLA